MEFYQIYLLSLFSWYASCDWWRVWFLVSTFPLCRQPLLGCLLAWTLVLDPFFSPLSWVLYFYKVWQGFIIEAGSQSTRSTYLAHQNCRQVTFDEEESKRKFFNDFLNKKNPLHKKRKKILCQGGTQFFNTNIDLIREWVPMARIPAYYILMLYILSLIFI